MTLLDPRCLFLRLIKTSWEKVGGCEAIRPVGLPYAVVNPWKLYVCVMTGLVSEPFSLTASVCAGPSRDPLTPTAAEGEPERNGLQGSGESIFRSVGRPSNVPLTVALAETGLKRNPTCLFEHQTLVSIPLPRLRSVVPPSDPAARLLSQCGQVPGARWIPPPSPRLLYPSQLQVLPVRTDFCLPSLLEMLLRGNVLAM